MDHDTKLMYASILAIRFGLLDLIPKSLRAISIICKDLDINLFFYYHGELLEHEKEMMTIDIIAAFSDGIDNDLYRFFGSITEFAIFPNLIRLDSPLPIPKNGCLAYKIYEPDKFDKSDYFFPENFKEDLLKLYQKPLRVTFFIAAQKALLNRIESNLREIDVAFNEKIIYLYFYYDENITELNRLLANEAVEEIKLSFPDYKFDFKILLSHELKTYVSKFDWTCIFGRQYEKS